MAPVRPQPAPALLTLAPAILQCHRRLRGGHHTVRGPLTGGYTTTKENSWPRSAITMSSSPPRHGLPSDGPTRGACSRCVPTTWPPSPCARPWTTCPSWPSPRWKTSTSDAPNLRTSTDRTSPAAWPYSWAKTACPPPPSTDSALPRYKQLGWPSTPSEPVRERPTSSAALSASPATATSPRPRIPVSRTPTTARGCNCRSHRSGRTPGTSTPCPMSTSRWVARLSSWPAARGPRAGTRTTTRCCPSTVPGRPSTAASTPARSPRSPCRTGP